MADRLRPTIAPLLRPRVAAGATGTERAAAGGEPGSAVRRPIPWGALALSAVAVVLLGIAFGQTFRTLWTAWLENDNYSHGVLILPISAFLAWRARAELGALPIRSTLGGLPLLGVGILLQLVGTRGDVTIFQGWGFVATIGGLVWTWFGRRVAWRLAFPIGFLFFMVPALPIFMNVVSFRLKEVAATGSVQLAQLLGAPVLQRGMDLYFPSGTLTVENACSGMNSLIALMALGALFAYLGTGPYWRRGLLFVAAIPIAIIANVVRITSLCMAASLADTETASGLFHDIGGFVLFGVALLLLAATKRALRC